MMWRLDCGWLGSGKAKHRNHGGGYVTKNSPQSGGYDREDHRKLRKNACQDSFPWHEDIRSNLTRHENDIK
jgi:hypothetical protein